MSRQRSQSISTKVFYGLGAVLMVLGLLMVARPVLIPVGLSVLLAFILSPLVSVLEGWKLGRLASVLVASFLAFALIGISLWALGTQLSSLAMELPNHRQEIKNKINSLSIDDDSAMSRLTEMVDELVASQAAEQAASESSEGTSGFVQSISPIPVVVKNEDRSQLTAASEILVPIVEPLATAALVVVLVMFLLIRREDVRYRVIALMGSTTLTGTTRLMQDAAGRVSKYLLNLLLVNAGFGLWFGVGLYLLDVPYAALWGFLTLVFRFIPYLGSPASVLFPLLISIATSSGWSQPIYIAIFFTISELVTANIIEPVLFGKTTGLTPIALLIAALFWAWIWGPVGLLLSTPLTVCLVVLGQHLPHLRSLKVLLAEQPTLEARLQFFQRLLAGDAAEGHRVFQEYADEFGRERAFDEVILPALKWTRRERLKEVITPEEERFIWNASHAAIAKAGIDHVEAERGDRQAAADSETVASSEISPPAFQVYGYPVHHESEEIALLMLEELIADQCQTRIATTKQLPSSVVQQICASQPDVVVLVAIPPGGMPQVRYMCRELRKQCDQLPIIVACLGKISNYDRLLVSLRKQGATYLTTSLAQTRNQIDTLLADQPVRQSEKGEVTCVG